MIINKPKTNTIYKHYNHGVKTPENAQICEVIEYIPFNNAGDELVSKWFNSIKSNPIIYSSDTDGFIIGKLAGSIFNPSKKNAVYSRSTSNEWVSFGECLGVLDNY